MTEAMPLTKEALTLLRTLKRCQTDGLKMRFSAKRHAVAVALADFSVYDKQRDVWWMCPLVTLEHSPRTGFVIARLTFAGALEVM